MLHVAKGKEVVAVEGIRPRMAGFDRLVVDVGTGAGRFAYELARARPRDFVVGLDPVAENMAAFARRARRKPARGGVQNLEYVVASIERVPAELSGLAHEIYTICPWGSLLEGLATATPAVLDGFRALAAPAGASFHFCLTYDLAYEAGEIERRGLPELSLTHFLTTLTPLYRARGLAIDGCRLADNQALKRYSSAWAKKLAFGRARQTYLVDGRVVPTAGCPAASGSGFSGAA